MLKLVKWTLIGGVGVAALGFFLFGDHAASYLSTMTGSVREHVRGNIPVEFELKRAEKLIKAIDPEIDTCKRDVARAEVELENLTQDVIRLEDDVSKAEKKLRNNSNILVSAGGGQLQVTLASHDLSKRRVEMDLERTFEVFKNNVALLRGKKALIDRQSKAVTAARARLDAVRTEKGRLEDTVATLKTQKAQLDALAAGARRFDLDDSNLSKAKEVLTEVKKRLDVAQRMIEDDAFFCPAGAERTKSDRDIAKEIHEYFSSSAGASAQAPELVLENGCCETNKQTK